MYSTGRLQASISNWKTWEEPTQPFASGVTVIDAVPACAVKAAIFPLPEAGRPIAVLSLLQLKTVPLTPLPVKLTAAVCSPLQRFWSAGSFTEGIGLIVGLKDLGHTVCPLSFIDETLLVTGRVIGTVISVVPLFTGVILKVLEVPELRGLFAFHW